MKLLKTLTSVGVISVMVTTGLVSSLKSVSAFGQSTLSDSSSVQVTGKMLISVAPNWQAKLPKVKDSISTEIATFLKNNYAVGNERDASVEALEIRGSKLYMRAQIRSRQVTKVFGKKVVTYSLTNTVETSFDPLNPQATMDQSRLCFNKAPVIGGGKVCASASDIVRIATLFL